MTIRSHLAYACSAILLAIIIAMSAACGKHTGVPPPVAYGDPTNGWTIYGPAGQNIIPIELDAGAWQVEYCVAERPGGANLQISVSSDTQNKGHVVVNQESPTGHGTEQIHVTADRWYFHVESAAGWSIEVTRGHDAFQNDEFPAACRYVRVR